MLYVDKQSFRKVEFGLKHVDIFVLCNPLDTFHETK